MWTLIHFQLLQHLRRPSFWGVVGVFGFWICLLPWITFFTFGEKESFLRETGLSTLLLGALTLLYLLTEKSLSSKGDSSALGVLLTKPLSRRAYVIGTFGHLYGAVGIACLLWLSLLTANLYWHTGSGSTFFLIKSTTLLLAELAILTAWGVLLQLYTRSLWTFLGYLLFFFLGHFKPFLEAQVGEGLGFVVWFWLPNLTLFHTFSPPISFFFLSVALGYGIVYTICILVTTFWLFDQTEL